MDRRQKKTRKAIFDGFIKLLDKKPVDKITVGEIIEEADVGRATFYAHFETKEFLLKEMCRELFCHIFDCAEESNNHKHIFDCDSEDSAFLHLFRHFHKNDNKIFQLITLKDSDVFIKYFRDEMRSLVEKQVEVNHLLPQKLIIDHITASFINTLIWWKNNGLKETPEEINDYFLLLIKNFLKK